MQSNYVFGHVVDFYEDVDGMKVHFLFFFYECVKLPFGNFLK